MRFAGRLHGWNEQRGFGFIRPLHGGDEVFVHVSALPAPRPGPDEVLTFEVAADASGRKKAVHVRRQSDEVAAVQADRARDARRAPTRAARDPRRSGSRLGGLLAALVATAALTWFGYGAYQAAAAKQARPSDIPSAGEPLTTSPARNAALT